MVDVHRVVPVGEADARQPVRAAVLEREANGTQHVLPDRLRGAVLVRDALLEVGEVARLPQVRADGDHEPEVVVAEPLRPLRDTRRRAPRSPRRSAGRTGATCARRGTGAARCGSASRAPAPGLRAPCRACPAPSRACPCRVPGPSRRPTRSATSGASSGTAPGSRRRPSRSGPGRASRRRSAPRYASQSSRSARNAASAAAGSRYAAAIRASLVRVARDPEHVDDPPLLARRELELVAERADAVPARRLASRRLALLDDERRREVAAAADECLAVGVEADGRRTRREERRVRAEDGPGQDRRRSRSGCARCAAPSRGSAGRRRRPESRARRS